MADKTREKFIVMQTVEVYLVPVFPVPVPGPFYGGIAFPEFEGIFRIAFKNSDVGTVERDTGKDFPLEPEHDDCVIEGHILSSEGLTETAFPKGLYIHLYQRVEVLFPNRFGIFFYGIPEERPGHGPVSDGEVGREAVHIAFARFAEEPSYRLLEQVVERFLLREEAVGYRIGIVQVALTDEIDGRDNSHPLFPEGPAVIRQIVEEGAVAGVEPGPEYLVAGEIHQIPVVDEIGMGEVEGDTLLLETGVLLTVPEKLHERQKRSHTDFMIRASDGGFEVFKGGTFPALLHNRTDDGDPDAEEPVPLAILSGPSLEETGQASHLGGVSMRKQSGKKYRRACIHSR